MQLRGFPQVPSSCKASYHRRKSCIGGEVISYSRSAMAELVMQTTPSHDEKDVRLQEDPDNAPADEAAWSSKWRAELRVIVQLAVPVMTTMATQQGMVVTDQIMVGHLGADELAAASLGNTWFNFWLYFMMGMATALDTLGSQAHGAKDMVAFWAAGTSSAAVLSLALVPMALGLWFSGSVVKVLFQQPEDLAEMSGEFCRLLIPGLWPMIWGLVATKLLQTRGVMTPPALIGIATFLANIGLNKFFIGRFGFFGAPVATTLSRVLQAVLSFAWLGLDLHVKGRGCSSTWPELLRGGMKWRSVGAFVVLGLPGGLMLLMEAASFEITTALAGRLGTMAVDTHTILLSLLGFAFMSGPFGLAIAGSIRVGMLLGAGDAATARISGALTVLASMVYMAVAIAFLWISRDRVGRWFVGNDESIVGTVSALLPIMLAVQMFDGISGATSGVLRGMGKQRLLLLYNIIGFWLGGMIPGYIMTFYFDLGLKGLWYGIACGITSTAVLCVVSLFLTDVKEEARLAQSRVQQLGGEAERQGGRESSALESSPNSPEPQHLQMSEGIKHHGKHILDPDAAEVNRDDRSGEDETDDRDLEQQSLLSRDI